jgi:hypothetical protein
MVSRNRAPETEALLVALRALKKGESVTFEELSGRVGFPVSAHIGNLDSARRILLREQFGKIERRGEVVQLVDDNAVVGRVAPQYRRKASRAAFRGANALHSVDYGALPEPDQKLHNYQLAVFGALRAAVSAQAPKKLPPKEEQVSVAALVAAAVRGL